MYKTLFNKSVTFLPFTGKKHILKCLLEIYVMFNNSEPRYLLNQLYIRDYIIWIQKAVESHIKSLSVAFDKVNK